MVLESCLYLISLTDFIKTFINYLAVQQNVTDISGETKMNKT